VDRPNVVVIVTDTYRRDHLGCYGNDWIRTPHIDRFAEQALVFDRAYHASFPTVPQRRDLFTGRFSATYSYWGPLPPDEVVLADVMTKAGYTTMMITDCPHTLENGYHYDRGFMGWEWIRGQETDRWRTDPESPTLPAEAWKLREGAGSFGDLPHRRVTSHWQSEEERFAPRTMIEAGRWLERNYKRTKPFFLYVDTFDPHEPWDAPQWYVDLYDPGYKGDEVDNPLYTKADYLTPAELKHARALYAAECTMVDRWIGHLLDRLEDTGQAANTIVLLTTDHGFLHGEHGYIGKSLFDLEGRGVAPTYSNLPLWEEIAHVPLIVRSPEGLTGRTSAMVQPTDIMPTILALAGVECPDTVQGRSFAPILRNDNAAAGDAAISFPSLILGGMGAARITITTDRWSYVCGPTAFDERLGDNIKALIERERNNPYTTKAVDGYEKELNISFTAPDELYDLTADPTQQTDLIGAHPDVARSLRAEIVDRLRALGTADPILACWEKPQA